MSIWPRDCVFFGMHSLTSLGRSLVPLLWAASAAAQVYVGRSGQTEVAIPRLTDTVRVDGVLDEAAWGKAAVLTGFSQFNPTDGRPATDSTEALVWYGPDAIYFAVRAYAPAGTVRATLADQIGRAHV